MNTSPQQLCQPMNETLCEILGPQNPNLKPWILSKVYSFWAKTLKPQILKS